MNNLDDEIGIGEGECQAEGPDLESNIPPTPNDDNNNPCASKPTRVNNVREDETCFYKGMTFKNKQELSNHRKLLA